jgi:mannosyltransferase
MTTERVSPDLTFVTSLDAPVTGLLGPEPPTARRRWSRRLPDARRIAVSALIAVVAFGLVLRFWASSSLWLDEAQSVAIARLPLGQLFDALRQDGSPPLYYLLLHGWMAVFGTGDFAVRALSGVFSVAALPVVYLMGRRIAGHRVGAVAALFLLTSPFAIRYATETRMYSLLVLLTLVGFLALSWVERRADRWPVVALAATTAALLYTHYWAIFLVAVVGLVVLVRVLRHREDRVARRQLLGIGLGGLAVLPWVPSLLYQLQHTGTPWTDPASLTAVLHSIGLWSGGGSLESQLLVLLFLVLLVLGIFGRRGTGREIVLDISGTQTGRMLAGVSLGTLAVAIGTSLLTHSAFAARYTSVAIGPFLVLLAIGTQMLGEDRVRRTAVCAAVVLGLWVAVPAVYSERSQAGELGAALTTYAASGDVVAFCPDQLGPSVMRYAPQDLVAKTFPSGAKPGRVNWVNYQERIGETSPEIFGRGLLETASGHGLWLVAGSGYRGLGDKCDQLLTTLSDARPGVQQLVGPDTHSFERGSLYYFPAD